MGLKNSFILISPIFIILLSGCTTENVDTNEPNTIIENKSVIDTQEINQSLGSICSGELECISYCQINREECENYCNREQNKFCPIALTQDPIDRIWEKRCTNNSNPSFTEPFTENEKILSVSPLGGASFPNPGSSMRSYISMKREEVGAPMIPVYAPVESYLLIIVYADRHFEEGVRAEYRLDFQVSCEVTYSFDHLAEVSDKVKKFAPKTSADTTGYKTAPSVLVYIPISAGELVGYTNRNTIANNWDFLVVNKIINRTFINPSRWVADHSLYGTCPYDYYTEDLKNFYYSLLNELHPSQPKCGDTIKEIRGTLAGAWFQGDANENKGSRMSLQANVQVLVIDIIRENGERFNLRDTSGGKILPEDISVGENVCYHDNQKNVFAFFKLISETEMKLVTGNGSCPSSFPSGEETWIR